MIGSVYVDLDHVSMLCVTYVYLASMHYVTYVVTVSHPYHVMMLNVAVIGMRGLNGVMMTLIWEYESEKLGLLMMTYRYDVNVMI